MEMHPDQRNTEAKAEVKHDQDLRQRNVTSKDGAEPGQEEKIRTHPRVKTKTKMNPKGQWNMMATAGMEPDYRERKEESAQKNMNETLESNRGQGKRTITQETKTDHTQKTQPPQKKKEEEKTTSENTKQWKKVKST